MANQRKRVSPKVNTKDLFYKISNTPTVVGGALAEWSKVLLRGEKINENQKDPGFATRPGQTFKTLKNKNIPMVVKCLVAQMTEIFLGSTPIAINSSSQGRCTSTSY